MASGGDQRRSPLFRAFLGNLHILRIRPRPCRTRLPGHCPRPPTRRYPLVVSRSCLVNTATRRPRRSARRPQSSPTSNDGRQPDSRTDSAAAVAHRARTCRPWLSLDLRGTPAATSAGRRTDAAQATGHLTTRMPGFHHQRHSTHSFERFGLCAQHILRRRGGPEASECPAHTAAGNLSAFHHSTPRAFSAPISKTLRGSLAGDSDHDGGPADAGRARAGGGVQHLTLGHVRGFIVDLDQEACGLHSRYGLVLGQADDIRDR